MVLLQNFVCKHAQKRIRISDAVANIRFAHNSVNARHDGVFDVRANVADGVVVHIKRATRDICLLRKLAYGDVGHVLFLHKLFERLEDRVFGFDDSFIYDELSLKPSARKLPSEILLAEEAIKAFQQWTEKSDKVEY